MVVMNALRGVLLPLQIFEGNSQLWIGAMVKVPIQRATVRMLETLYSVEELFTSWLISGYEWEWFSAPDRKQ